MSKKGVDVGTTILIGVIVIVSASIAGINLLTVFGIIDSPDLMTYAGFVGLVMIPTVIIGGAINKIIIEQKKAINQFFKNSSNIGDKVELKINLKKYETTLADTTLHTAFYVKIAVASLLSVIAGFYTLIIVTEGITGDVISIYPIWVPLFIVITIIHLFSKHMFEPKGWREFFEHTWIALFVIIISISFMVSLKKYIQEAYPRSFWETFLGLPFSLQTIMFFLILLLLGAILIRLGDILKLETSPLKASGITLVLVSVFFLIPQFQFIPFNYFLELLTIVFSVILIIYGIVTALVLYKDAGLRYIITNVRIIKLNTHHLEKSINYHLYDLKNIGVIQDFLAKKFGYGNIVGFFKNSDDEKIRYCVLHGVKNPYLLLKTIKTIASRSTRKKKKVRTIGVKRVKESSSKGLFYRSLLPIILISLFLFAFFPIYTVKGQEDDLPSVVEYYDIQFDDFTKITIKCDYEIYNLRIDSKTMNTSEIRFLYHSGGINKELIEERLISSVDFMVTDKINHSFGLSSKQYSYDISIVQNSLNLSLQNDQSVQLSSTANVSLNNDFYDIPDDSNLQEFIYGTLKIGAEIDKKIPIMCQPGHTVEYTLHAPEDVEFQNKTTINWKLENIDGTEVINGENNLNIKHENPISIDSKAPNMDLFVDIYEITRGIDREYVTIDLKFSAQIRTITMPEEVSNKIQDFFKITYINADMLRLLYNNGFNKQINNYLDYMEDEIKVKLSTFSTQYINDEMIIMGLNEVGYNPYSMDSNRPINIYFNTSFQKNLTINEARSSLDIKSRYLIDEKISFNLAGLERWGLNYTIKVPPKLELIDASAGGRELEVKTDPSGRYYITDRIPAGNNFDVELTMGTYIDIYSLLPFIVIILIMFCVWVGLNLYPEK